MSSTAILLAAGLGTRMRSTLPKVLHPLGGRPMLSLLLAEAEAVFDRVVVVVGPGMEAVAALAHGHEVVVQHERRGTAHAARTARALFGDGDVAILYGDNPLITRETMRGLLEGRQCAGASLALLAMRPADPAGYGRVIEEAGRVVRIVELADAGPAERAVGLCNAGVMCADAELLGDLLERVGQANARGEQYLTDIVGLANAAGGRVVAFEADADELRGINSRAELAQAEAVLQRRLRASALAAGVTLVAPETVFLAADTRFEPDVLVEPNVVFGPGVAVASGAVIRAFSHLEGCRIEAGAVVGPYARIRPGTRVGEAAHVGNFVELKATDLGAGAKANHLAYLGDARIGARTNIGAGTITCNYDGYAKHPTEIGTDVFVGSDAVLVAPVSIGDRSLVAAGSVITANVAADGLAFGRARQETKDGAAVRLRARLKARRGG